MPQPQDVQGSVVIAVQARAAVGAGMPTDGQAFRGDDTAARTGLTGERGMDCLHSLSGSYRLGSEDGEERTPPRIADAFGVAGQAEPECSTETRFKAYELLQVKC